MGKCTSAPHENNVCCHDTSKGVVSVTTNKKLAMHPVDVDMTVTNSTADKEKSKRNDRKLLKSISIYNNQNNIDLNSNSIYRPYIFFTNLIFHNKQKLHLFVDAYCKQMLSEYNDIQIPMDIIALFVAFYPIQRSEPVPLPRYLSKQNNEIMFIDDNKEHIFKELYLWETDLIGASDDIKVKTMRITVCNDLVIKEYSKIIGPNKGTIILNVLSDLEIESNAQIICPNGNIFIKSKNLKLKSSANISTYHDINGSKLIDGNIYMEIADNIMINNDDMLY